MGNIFGGDDDEAQKAQDRLEQQLEEEKARQAEEDKKIQMQRLDALRARRGRATRSSLMDNQAADTLG